MKLRSPAVWLHAVAGACPEGGLIHVKLVAEGVAPDVRPVRASVRRMGDPRSQDPAVVQVELVGDSVVPAGLPAGVPHRLPALRFAEALMVTSGGSRPGHCADPVIHWRNWSSSLRATNCTSPQCSRGFGACCKRGQSSAYSRNASPISPPAPSYVAPPPATGTPALNPAHP